MPNKNYMMNISEAESRCGELAGILYWHYNGTFPIKDPKWVIEKSQLYWGKGGWGELEDALVLTEGHETAILPDPNAKWVVYEHAELAVIVKRLNDKYYPPEYNEQGNIVRRSFHENVDGDHDAHWIMEKILDKGNWMLYPSRQDAYYFQTWYSFDLLQVACYAEGDLTVTTCQDIDHFMAEMRELENWNRKHGWLIIDLNFDELHKAIEKVRA